MKKLIFTLILILLLAVLLEGTGRIGLRMLNGKWTSPGPVVAELAGESGGEHTDGLQRYVRATGRMPSYMQQHILHPYLGFIRNPDVPEHQFVERTVPFSVNEFGFFGPTPLVKKSPDRFQVFVTGGSVALEFFIDAKDRFEELLSELPQTKGKKVEVISIALGGLKQPQQVIVLNYLLSIGAEPDMVIALDGFNEVVLPLVENVPNGVYPYFPRKWNIYGGTSLDMEAAVLAGAIALRREEVESSRQFIRDSKLRRSALAVALWQSAHRKKAIRRTESEQALQAFLQERSVKYPPQLTGPSIGSLSKAELSAACADVWFRGSRQMWELCKSHNILFMQFLQPNQYLKGTKVLTEWERQHAIADDGYVWRLAAIAGYPSLLERGTELAAMGVPYSDLTDIYVHVSETIYKDICCHVNALGAELLAERMAKDLSLALTLEAARDQW